MLNADTPRRASASSRSSFPNGSRNPNVDGAGVEQRYIEHTGRSEAQNQFRAGQNFLPCSLPPPFIKVGLIWKTSAYSKSGFEDHFSSQINQALQSRRNNGCAGLLGISLFGYPDSHLFLISAAAFQG